MHVLLVLSLQTLSHPFSLLLHQQQYSQLPVVESNNRINNIFSDLNMI
jgi:predicted transcriptional regulator